MNIVYFSFFLNLIVFSVVQHVFCEPQLSDSACTRCLADCIYGGIVPTAKQAAAQSLTEMCHEYCTTSGCNGKACPDCKS